MIDKKTAKKVLDKLLESGGSFGEIFIQQKVLNNFRLDDNKIENASSGFENGCGLRLIYKDSTYYAFIDSREKEKLLESAKILSAAVNNSNINRALNLNDSASSYNISILKYPDKVLPDEKKSILTEVNNTARNKSSNIIQVTATLFDSEEEILIANSEGVYASYFSVKAFLAVSTIAAKDREIRTGYKSFAKTRGFELFEEKKPADIAAQSADMAINMLDAVNAPSGILPVVIGNGFGGVIFHEACGHGLEADAIIKNASVFKDKIGKKIASDMVTATDDSTLAYHWGSYKFDSEGCPSARNVLIEKGILTSYLLDIKSARKLNMSLTGNGRRQSYRDIPFPRMSNTFIENGNEDPEIIISSVKKGIYAKEFSGGQVDPATGDFVFGISEGYLIDNGKLSNPIKGATLIGNGPEILNKIEAIGNDLDYAPGFCGKNGQSVTNEVGQPTIKISAITVGGTGHSE
ncbi:MAG: TldD/PmbA family protein [Actinobacteria bacterium]|nr:TldD/PmbA family protein [Actinomycetota bacterium]